MVYELMIWIGAALSLAGLCGLVWCILRVTRAKKAALDDDAMRAELQKIVPLNMGSLLLSVFGLILVAMGAALG